MAQTQLLVSHGLQQRLVGFHVPPRHTTSFTHDNAGRVLITSSPAPDAGGGALATTNTYDVMGRVTAVQLPDSTTTTTSYDLRGNRTGQDGSQTYPVSYTYDPQGRMLTMTTTNAEGPSVTTWIFDTQRGWLNRKEYHDSNGTDYTYTDAGKLETRTWERGVVTTYDYNAAGELVLVDYSDSTPDVVTTYKTWGAVHTVADAAGTRTMAYDAHLRPTTEALGTLHDNRVLTRSYDTYGRPDGIEVGTTGDPDADHFVNYGYNSAGRLNTVSDARDTWTYSFVADSDLLAQTASSVSTVLYTYENNRNVLKSVENKVGTNTISEYEYGVNRIGQRTERTQSGGAFLATSTDDFAYNIRGEVIGSENSVNSTREFAYAYDPIGNRTSYIVASGTPTTYEVNGVNQYTEIEQSPDPALTPTNDVDGNEITDGKGNELTWDGENRLIEFKPTTPASGDKRVVNTYDGQSRRVGKEVFQWDGTAWQPQTNEVFLYDSWNPAAIYTLHNSNFTLHTSLTWGRDLSGSMQGAGGVGGLLSTFNGGTDARMFYDGNGNVGQVVNGFNDQTVAVYEYDPFGNLVTSTGSFAEMNPYKFSTKYLDAETSLYFYGYRIYNPETGRWINRDPIEEEGGMNLYGFVGNDSENRVDYLGLQTAIPFPPVSDGPLSLSFTQLGEIQTGNCGEVDWLIVFVLSNIAPDGGLVVQRINVNMRVWDCEGNEIQPENPPPNLNRPFRETFPVQAGSRSSSSHDAWGYTGGRSCTRGEITWSGEARFHNGIGTSDLPSDFQVDNSPHAPGQLTSTRTYIPLVDLNRIPGRRTNAVTRRMKATWDCCSGEQNTEVSMD